MTNDVKVTIFGASLIVLYFTVDELIFWRKIKRIQKMKKRAGEQGVEAERVLKLATDVVYWDMVQGMYE